MSPPTAKFNVGGTVFEVAVSTIQSHPGGLLAKMIDGRLGGGKDESGAYFIDRSPRFFEIVLDVHRDNKVYALSPGMTRERVVAELEFYGLPDFDGVPMDRSVESTLRDHIIVSSDFPKWQKEQQRLGRDLLDEGFARLFLAQAELPKEPGPAILEMHPIELDKCMTIQRTPGNGEKVYPSAKTNTHIVKFFEDWGTKATIDNSNKYHPKINL